VTSRLGTGKPLTSFYSVFVNVNGSKASIPMNRFRQPMWPDGPVRQIGSSVPARQGWESIPGILKRFTNTSSES
jgi:hypothetical protein